MKIVNLQNKLPESVVESSSVNVFKKRLDDWIADVDFKSSASDPLHHKLQVKS